MECEVFSSGPGWRMLEDGVVHPDRDEEEGQADEPKPDEQEGQLPTEAEDLVRQPRLDDGREDEEEEGRRQHRCRSPHRASIQVDGKGKVEGEVFSGGLDPGRGSEFIQIVFHHFGPVNLEEVVKVLLVGEDHLNLGPVGTIIGDHLSRDETGEGRILSIFLTVEVSGDVSTGSRDTTVVKVLRPGVDEEEGGVGHLGGDHLLTPTLWVGSFPPHTDLLFHPREKGRKRVKYFRGRCWPSGRLRPPVEVTIVKRS